ncbi:MAG TPA: ribosome biogenesis GTPase Der [Cyclobacteriaceae bacterium]|nr:ribosome biogenesis GTPase Der [Cyclobacteriaceae bacterium]
MANIVAIVGRPNVGKSTFFNRLIEKRQAIMDNEAGVTRDRHYGHAEWCGKYFTVIDTGGYVIGSDDKFESEIRKQVKMAMDEASVVLFMVDAKDGLTPLDKEFAKVVRTSNKPVYLVANKADTTERAFEAVEFYELGMGEVYPIAAADGSGTGDLLDEVVKNFPDPGVEDPYAGIPKIAIVGRPNAGKSSLLNVLLGTERSIVTDEAGTTRDAIHSHYKMYGKDFILIDTAGIRKKSKVHEDVEFYSVLRALRSIEESDVCIVVIDADRGIESQDVSIVGLAQNHNKGMVIMVNKWDLIEKDSKTSDAFKKLIRERIAPLDYVPVIFSSVLKKQRIFQVIEKAIEVYENLKKKIPTSELNDKMLPEIAHYPPPALKGKNINIKYITQLPNRTPTFAFFCNLPQYIKAPYVRFLENKLRSHFGFEGAPIRIIFKKK